MKTYSLDEITDKYIGKKGTENRELFENELKVEIIGLTIRQIRKERNLTQEQLGDLVGVKKAQMAQKDEAQKVTGYLLGGISPLGQKKLLRTVLHESVNDFKTIFISGGKRGLDIEVFPKDLKDILKAKIGRIVSQ